MLLFFFKLGNHTDPNIWVTLNPQAYPNTFHRYLIAIQFIISFWFITTVGLSSKLNFDFDAKAKCFSRALKCHFLPQMHQETHNQF